MAIFQFQKMLLLADVTASISYFVALEVLHFIEMPIWIGLFTTSRLRAVVAMFWMEVVVYVAVEASGAVKPGADADEDAAGKPFRTVIAVGGALVGSGVIVAVGTFRGDSDVDLHLSLSFGRRHHETDGGSSSEHKKRKSIHSLVLTIVILNNVPGGHLPALTSSSLTTWGGLNLSKMIQKATIRPSQWVESPIVG
jgi:hypothetical protein